MIEKFYEITEEKLIDKAINFVLSNFKLTEKSIYTPEELTARLQGLKQFDVFIPSELTKLVNLKKIKVFVLTTIGGIVGVSALELESGRILLLSAKPDKNLSKHLLLLVEKMVEAREDAPDNRLQMLAFLGQVPELLKIGFTKIYDTTLFNYGIKFQPLQYNYTQIDIEK